MPNEILPDLYRIKIPLPGNPLRLLNSYVIKGEDRNLLIDTGFKMPECKEALATGLNELEISMDKTDILLTHLHSDHSGLAPEFASESSRVFIGRDELPWMFGESRLKLWLADNVKYKKAGFSDEAVAHLDEAVSRGLASDPYFDRYTPLDGDEELVYGGYCLRPVVTRGHTPMHMCFWMEEQKVMFTGDHVLFDITPNITEWGEMYDSLGEYLDSLQRVKKYDVRIALPGHRESGNFQERVDKLMQHHEERLDECLNIIKNNPGLTIYDISGKMKWKIRCNSWEDFPLGQKWFAVGECHSHVRHLECLGKVKIEDRGKYLHIYER